MRHTFVTMVTVFVAAAAIIYAALVVSREIRQVGDQIDVVARDLRTMGDDIASIADDVNAIATALAGDEDDEDQQQSPVAQLGASPAGAPALLRRAAARGDARVARRHGAFRHATTQRRHPLGSAAYR